MREALEGGREDEVKDELGDLFFVLTNFGRMLGMDCEDTVRYANAKFERRFKYIESELKKKGVNMKDSNLQEMESLWQEAKKEEKKRASG